MTTQYRNIPADHFNKRDGNGKTDEYVNIITEILEELRISKPNTCGTVDNIIEHLKNPEAFYGLLVGEIQSGKTPAQMILTWIFSRHPDFLGHVCFVTKKLDSIRRDIMGKFESDLINRHIIAVCARRNIRQEDAVLHFGLTYHIYKDRQPIDSLGTGGQVEIMLMESRNFTHIRSWYSKLTKESRPAPILFLVDEMHEMNGGEVKFLGNNGLTDAKHVSNIGMLHWFHKKCLLQRSYLIGVTATPFAPMSADPVCCPKRVYKLTTDAPAPGLTYYGYNNYELVDDVSMNIYNTEMLVDIEAINEITEREHTVLENGNTEVKFICLTNRHYNEEHCSAATSIREKLGNRVNVLVFNQENTTNLSEYFAASLLTREVCETGAIIIIGKACMAAGITIKPSSRLCVKHGEITYELTGITDQFMPNNTIDVNVTSTMQLMRLQGWFPNGHESNLWLPSEELFDVYRTEFGYVMKQFMEGYDPEVGPASVEEINLNSQHIKRFYTSNPYVTGDRFGNKLIEHYNHPTDEHGVPLIVMDCNSQPVDQNNIAREFPEDPNVLDRTIGSFFKRSNDQDKLRKAIGFKLRERMEIGYFEERYDNILKAACVPQPGENGERNPWQVNGFLWGPQGHQSKLRDCHTVNFTEDWDVRPTGENVTFQTPAGCWYTIERKKTMIHNNLKEFERIAKKPEDERPDSLSVVHHQTLAQLDKNAEAYKKTGRKLNAWTLFMRCYKLVHGTGTSQQCSEPYQLYKARFTELSQKSIYTQHQLLELGRDIIAAI